MTDTTVKVAATTMAKSGLWWWRGQHRNRVGEGNYAFEQQDISEKAGRLSSLGGSLDDTRKPASTPNALEYPEGGVRAWLCVAGGAACFFCSFGWISCMGVFQDYYERVPLRGYSPSVIGWIQALEVFLLLICGPAVGYYFDNHGPRQILALGTTLHVIGLVMASASTKYYQFLLSQGVCSAIGASMIFYPAMTCTSTWFFERRGLAVSCVTAGTSLGGIIFPIVVYRFIPLVGFGWAMRICALIILTLMVFANLTVTSRLPPTPRPFDLLAFVRPLREPAFLALTTATFCLHYGMFVPFSFIVTDANAQGMPLNLAQYLPSIINAGSILGRIFPGYLGDRVGRYNTMTVCCILTGISVLTLWLPARRDAVFFAFCPSFGFASGAAMGLLPALIAQISDVKDIGVRTGTVFGISSFAALTGTPIAGALIGSDDGSGFLHMKVFSGVFCLLSGVFYALARIHLKGFGLMEKV